MDMYMSYRYISIMKNKYVIYTYTYLYHVYTCKVGYTYQIIHMHINIDPLTIKTLQGKIALNSQKIMAQK